MEDLKLAILIDADNISPKYVKVILDEAATFGVAACKRIYGDWSDVRLKSWKDALLNNSIIPIQQYSYTTGKNATDSAMIIDAMDLLYGGNLDGFCIVSSDSDFTRLAARLREAGKLVIGMGESKALGPFVKACDQFKYLDLILDHGETDDTAPAAPPPRPPPAPTPGTTRPSTAIPLAALSTALLMKWTTARAGCAPPASVTSSSSATRTLTCATLAPRA